MEKHTYTIEQHAPRLGKVGDTVEMTERQARYFVTAGTLVKGKKSAAKNQPAQTKPASKKKG